MITTRQITEALRLHYMLTNREKELQAEEMTTEQLKEKIRTMKDDEIITVMLPEEGSDET